MSNCVTPETAAHQAPLSLGFSRQEHWSGLPFPSPMHESEKWKVKVKLLSHVRLLATPRTAAYQAPPPMGFSRQEYWSGLPLPSPNLCFLRGYYLFLFTTSILFIHNGLPGGTLPLSFTIKPKCLSLFRILSTCEQLAIGRKKWTHALPQPLQGWPFQEILARLIAFLLPHFLSLSTL